jgi:hypothetical protein
MRSLLVTGLMIVTGFFVVLNGNSSNASFAQISTEYAWVQYDANGDAVVRALTLEHTCPAVSFNGHLSLMQVRAEPNVDFAILTCESSIPKHADEISVSGIRLQPPIARPEHIAVIGDSGCRLKSGSSPDDGFQACNDPAAWPFESIAKHISDWGPDLIIHVGDYIYREKPCPAGNSGCAGSPHNSPGLRLDTWRDDFLDPASSLFTAAPIVFVRGNHEKCERAGRGYFRFLSPFSFTECTDFTPSYSLNFEKLQLVIMDLVQPDDTELASDVAINHYRHEFENLDALVDQNTWLLTHQPLWGVLPNNKDGSSFDIINPSLQQALQNPLPSPIEFVLSGHIHLGEVLSFAGDRPPSIIAGNSGAKLLPALSTDVVGTELDGEVITTAMTSSHHGFTTFERGSADTWIATFRNVDGLLVQKCSVANREATCE